MPDGLFVLAAVTDISARKAAESAREQLFAREQAARAEADAANRAKDEFVARVSHELRTPLSALIGWARMLRDGQLAPNRASHAIASIDRNAEALKTLVDDLLELSRVTAGRLQLDRRHLDLVAVVRESLNLLEPTAQAKGIQVELAIEREPLIVDGDWTRLRQVFGNLLSNAVKFTPEGGRVALQVRSADHQVHVIVSDTGQGIAPGFLPHVFDPFAQGDGGGQGLGLGLAIVHELISAHGGRVSVTSPGVGAGAAFTVVLPLVSIAEQV